MMILLGSSRRVPLLKICGRGLRLGSAKTSTTKLHTLHLKWMQYEMDSTHTIAEHLRTMSAVVRDLKAAGLEISKEEQVMNVIRALPSQPEH